MTTCAPRLASFSPWVVVPEEPKYERRARSVDSSKEIGIPSEMKNETPPLTMQKLRWAPTEVMRGRQVLQYFSITRS